MRLRLPKHDETLDIRVGWINYRYLDDEYDEVLTDEVLILNYYDGEIVFEITTYDGSDSGTLLEDLTFDEYVQKRKEEQQEYGYVVLDYGICEDEEL